MKRSGKTVSSHRGSIPFETVKEKRGVALAYFEKKNLISVPHSVAFVTIVECNLVHVYKFHGNLETAR